MKKTIIFDFDGTIADTFAVVVGLFKEVTRRKVDVPQAEITRLRGMALREVARELNISTWRVPFLLMRGRRLMTGRMDEVPIFTGMDETIRQLHNGGYQLLIMSSNSSQNIRKFLVRQGLEQCFTQIYGNVGLLHKDRALRKVLHRNKLTSKEVFYIGDEVRDVDAANRVGAPVVAVAWGYNDLEVLQEHKPLAIVASPQELLKVVEQ